MLSIANKYSFVLEDIQPNRRIPNHDPPQKQIGGEYHKSSYNNFEPSNPEFTGIQFDYFKTTQINLDNANIWHYRLAIDYFSFNPIYHVHQFSSSRHFLQKNTSQITSGKVLKLYSLSSEYTDFANEFIHLRSQYFYILYSGIEYWLRKYSKKYENLRSQYSIQLYRI